MSSQKRLAAIYSIFPRYVLGKFSLSLLLFTCATKKCHVNSYAAKIQLSSNQHPAKTILSLHHAQWYQLITEHRKWSACCVYNSSSGFVTKNRINYTFIFHVNAFRAGTLLIYIYFSFFGLEIVIDLNVQCMIQDFQFWRESTT